MNNLNIEVISTSVTTDVLKNFSTNFVNPLLNNINSQEVIASALIPVTTIVGMDPNIAFDFTSQLAMQNWVQIMSACTFSFDFNSVLNNSSYLTLSKITPIASILTKTGQLTAIHSVYMQAVNILYTHSQASFAVAFQIAANMGMLVHPEYIINSGFLETLVNTGFFSAENTSLARSILSNGNISADQLKPLFVSTTMGTGLISNENLTGFFTELNNLGMLSDFSRPEFDIINFFWTSIDLFINDSFNSNETLKTFFKKSFDANILFMKNNVVKQISITFK